MELTNPESTKKLIKYVKQLVRQALVTIFIVLLNEND